MTKAKLIIDALGGPTALGRKLGFTPQRVFNWTKKGIPSKVWLANRKIFDGAQRAVEKKRQ